MEKHPNEAFKVYVVWVPMRGAEEHHVPAATRMATDPRVRHYWDGANVLGNAYSSILGLNEPAWDVYMLFDQTARWTNEAMPKPVYWMHQLGGVTAAPRLDPEVFGAKAETLSNSSR